MIEVYLCGNRWAWSLISYCGRRIVWSDERFDCIASAAAAAKAYRAAFWAVADAIDHRQARAI